jgi:4-diphosphocytidyl-2-C-methyl-D-erythritol kinase
MGVKASVDIHIEKQLPVQGGLGAGSANAVAALIGLENELEKQGASEQGRKGQKSAWAEKRMEIAAKVGSDVPLFLIGGAVLGLDRGQNVSPLPDFEPLWCVVAIPNLGVSTPQAFRDWDALCHTEGLTAEASTDRLEKLSRAYVAAFSGNPGEASSRAGSSGVFSAREDLAGPQESALVRTGITSWIENDFERVVFPQHPSLAEIKRLLWAAGTSEAAVYAALSGSGSALFGLYLTRRAAQAAKDRLESQAKGVKAQITRTIPRAAYWDQMLEQVR